MISSFTTLKNEYDKNAAKINKEITIPTIVLALGAPFVFIGLENI
jgi:hypothetical protein